MLDENEYLSPYGIRSLSRIYRDHPYVFRLNGREYRVEYEPGESKTGLFGGNSNWRGPVWLPVNYLLIEALTRYHRFYGDTLRVECPTGSGRRMDPDAAGIVQDAFVAEGVELILNAKVVRVSNEGTEKDVHYGEKDPGRLAAPAAILIIFGLHGRHPPAQGLLTPPSPAAPFPCPFR